MIAARPQPAAAATVRVFLVDGQTKSGDELALAGGALSLKESGGASLKWPLEDVAGVQFEPPPAPPATANAATTSETPAASAATTATAAATSATAASSAAAASPVADRKPGWLRLAGGGLLRGYVESFNGDQFTVTTAELGAVALPVGCVEALGPDLAALGRMAAAGSGEEAGKDALLLANGDRLFGTLNALEAGRIKFHSNLGDLDLERSRVVAIGLGAPPAGRPKVAGLLLKVTLGDESVLQLAAAEIAGGRVSGAIPGGPRVAAPLERVALIQVIGGRLVLLESIKPAVYEQQSLDVLKWEIVPGRNVLNQPMVLRDGRGEAPVTYQSGLGVHGPCRLVYQLEGRYERFLSLAGIDESAGRWADANLVVKVDGQEVFRADHVKWQEAPREINVPLKGARQLELLVEAGEHYDVQDRINWAEARLLRAPEAAKK